MTNQESECQFIYLVTLSCTYPNHLKFISIKLSCNNFVEKEKIGLELMFVSLLSIVGFTFIFMNTVQSTFEVNVSNVYADVGVGNS